MKKIFIDADACPVPVKEILFKASGRLGISLILVTNQQMKIPSLPLISLVSVPDGADEADDRITELAETGDLVITADIPLADRVIRKGGIVLEPRGTLITEENIGQKLAARNLMTDLRAGGMQTGGPASYGKKDKQNFANQLDRLLRKL